MSPSTSNSFETLSTLRFADNVKRIKNKAIVNQDASGDAETLRKEVVRLRQLLAESQLSGVNGNCRNGEIDGKDPDDSFHDHDAGASQKALVAALTREERACRQVTSLQEELGALQGLVEAKEADLQRTKMMLRLKESRITSTPSAALNGSDQERSRLEGEIALLKQKIDSHPDVKKFALENIRLRRQLDLVTEGAQTAHTSTSAAVSAEEFGELRSELLAMTSRAEKLLNEVHMLRAEATASKEVLRTAEKRRRGSVDGLNLNGLGSVAYAAVPQHQEQQIAALQTELDEVRLLADTQAVKVAEYDRMCAHAGALDSAVETLTTTCRHLAADRDEWYSAYTDALQEIVSMWSIQSAMQSSLEAQERELATACTTHATANEHAKRRISEAMEAASRLDEELQQHQVRISRLDEELTAARGEATESREACEELRSMLRTKDAEISEMHSLVSRYSEQVETHANTADDLAKRLAAVKTAHQASSAEAASAARELKSTQAALAAAQIDAQMTASQLKEKTKQLTISEEFESELRATIISLQEELTDARADARAKDDLIDDLGAENATAKETIKSLSDQATTIDTLKKERSSLQARIKALEAKLNDRHDELENNAAAAGPMGQEAQARNYSHVSQKLADAEEKIITLREEAHALKAQVKSRDDAIAKLRNQMAMEVNDAAQQVQELLAAQARADRLERQLSALLENTAGSGHTTHDRL